MADDRIRDLERAARAGDRDAQARLLVELERLGTPVCKTPHRLMTPNEIEMATALAGCRFSPGSADKRFARHLSPQALFLTPWITAKQAAALRVRVKRYRRQLPADLVERAAEPYVEPLGLPAGKGYPLPNWACCTCRRPKNPPEAHARWCPCHPEGARRYEREQLGMFAPPEGP